MRSAEFNADIITGPSTALTDSASKAPDDAPLHFLLVSSITKLREFTRAVTEFLRIERSVSN